MKEDTDVLESTITYSLVMVASGNVENRIGSSDSLFTGCRPAAAVSCTPVVSCVHAVKEALYIRYTDSVAKLNTQCIYIVQHDFHTSRPS